MPLFIQLTLTGLTNGAILALAALGFVLIYKASDVINFAQGELLLVGAYMTYAMVAQFGLFWPIGVLITMAVAVLLGIVVERFVLRPMIGEPIISVIMVTIGLSSVIKAIAQSLSTSPPVTASMTAPEPLSMTPMLTMRLRIPTKTNRMATLRPKRASK